MSAPVTDPVPDGIKEQEPAVIDVAMTAPVPNGIEEPEPKTIEASRYSIAMTILEKDAAEGEGMTVRYQDHEDEMSRLQFADFVQGLASVSKMISILNVYRPELLDKIMHTIEPQPQAQEPAGTQPQTMAGAQPASATETASEPAAVTTTRSS